MDFKTVTKNSQIDFSLYVNTETGEMLASELIDSPISVRVKEETELVTKSKSEGFVVIEVDALMKIQPLLTKAELGNLLLLSQLTKTEMNMLYNNSVPHSNSSLQHYLEIKSNKTFTELIKKLIKIGVLYQVKGNINGAVRVVYIMNPYFSSRRKTFNNALFNMFKKF
jgi:hypothetical protein